MAQDHESLDWIGRRLDGKILVRERLGGGAMGDVYLAWHELLERPVAVKVLHAELACEPQYLGRFHREALAASRLDHPNVIRVHDFGHADGAPYLVMDHVDGRDLQRVLQEDGPLSPEGVAELLVQILDGVAAAHDAGIVHRDLKPENVLVVSTPDGPRVKICDFGIARVSGFERSIACDGPITGPGMVMGTPDYLSPEQARGETVDARSDLYSLGAVLYQMLTGRPPFEDTSAIKLLMRHVTEAPRPPRAFRPDAHAGLSEVALRALQKLPDHRYGSARAMRRAVRDALVPPPGPVPSAKRPWGMLLVGLGVIALGSVACFAAPAGAQSRARLSIGKAAAAAAHASPPDDAARRELDAWYAALSAPKPAPRRAAGRAKPTVRSYYDVVAAQ